MLSDNRRNLARLVESSLFKRCILALIVISALLLGVETFRGLGADVLNFLYRTNQVILGIFVIELLLRITAHGREFFREPWNVFDLAIGVVVAAIRTRIESEQEQETPELQLDRELSELRGEMAALRKELGRLRSRSNPSASAGSES